MQQSGRHKSHHAPPEQRQNFARRGTFKDANQVDPCYIIDYNGSLTKLDRRRSAEREEKRKTRNEKIKKCFVWSFVTVAVLLVILVLVLLLLYFLTCYLGNCPGGCYDCQFSESQWRKSKHSSSYSAKHRYCGGPLSATFTDEIFSVDSSIGLGSKEGLSTASPLVHSYSETDQSGTSIRKLKLYWYMDRTVRNNETLKLVFSDDGNQYSGGGGFGERMIRTKPGLSSEETHTFWSSESDPIYFPYYMTRNEHGSICMFLDSAGAPVEMTVKTQVTEWTVYKLDKMKFYIYSASTPLEALTKCNAKWQELFPSPQAFWSENFILGSFDTSQVKTAKNTDGILATHYLLSPRALSLNENGVAVEYKGVLTNYDNVFFTWDANQKIVSGSGLSTTYDNGYFKTSDEETYYLDYTTDNVKKVIEKVVTADTQGFLLKGGYLSHESVKCPEYLYCDVMDYDKTSNMCLDTTFSGGPVIETHNSYDRTRLSALKTAENTVFESVASPGTIHFHLDLKLTLEGLRTCFNTILNLQAVGVRAVTCNMCGGLIPVETNSEQTFFCDRWSMLAILMPYIIMSNDDTPPYITDKEDGGRYVNNNMKVRKIFRHELNAAFRDAASQSKPFVYPVSARYTEDIYTESNGVMIGETLFFIVVLEEPLGTKIELDVALPPGPWFSNGGPSLGEYYNGGQVIQQSSIDFSDLLFFSVGNIYVLDDIDNENHVVVKIFNSYEVTGTILTRDFVYYEPGTATAFTTTIVFNPSTKALAFTYNSGGTGATSSQDIKISKIEIYLWHVDNADPPAWVSFLARGDNKFNVELDYVEKGDFHSVFETWTQDSSVFG